MLNLITAVPGSGKTLFTLDRLRRESAPSTDFPDGRQVYYYAIPLTEEGKRVLGWIELEDPTKWYECPPGSIIVIDECQKVFTKRKSGLAVPRHVSEFETHRHLGLDVWLITQGPYLIDSHIHEIVNRHYHLKRIFGSKSAMVLAWDAVETKPNSLGASNRSMDKRKFGYPKEVFTWYKSSQVHTHKLAIPRKVFVLLGAVVMLIVGVVASVYTLGNLGENAAPKTASPPAQATAEQKPGVTPGVPAKPVQTAATILNDETPRVYGRPETAPLFDELRKPVDMPTIAGCIASSKSCKCITGQGSFVSMTESQCRQWLASPPFNPYREPEQRQVNLQDRSIKNSGVNNANNVPINNVAYGGLNTTQQRQNESVDFQKTPPVDLMASPRPLS